MTASSKRTALPMPGERLANSSKKQSIEPFFLSPARGLGRHRLMVEDDAVTFDDLINKSRGEREAAKGAEGSSEAGLARARATLDAALGQTGLSAAMALASHGVPAVPVGQIKQRFGFEYPEQTSRAWQFPRHLYLLRDGTWWNASSTSADINNAPPPVVRWAMGDDRESPGSILALGAQLTGAVLTSADTGAGGAPHGRFVSGGDGGEDGTLDFWVTDGAARVCEGAALEDSLPFEEWAASQVATLIDARSL